MPLAIDVWHAARHISTDTTRAAKNARKAGLIGIRANLVKQSWDAALANDVPAEAAVTLLHKESSGGLNLIGNDAGGWGYRPDGAQLRSSPALLDEYYDALEGDDPPGRQGWGPTQLTSKALQDKAQWLGGLDVASCNLLVGLEYLRAGYDRFGDWHGAFAYYNGSSVYADDAARLMGLYASYLAAVTG